MSTRQKDANGRWISVGAYTASNDEQAPMFVQVQNATGGAGEVQGSVASGAAFSSKPVGVGVRYDSTDPTSVDDGDIVEMRGDATGRPRVINDGALNPTDDISSVLKRCVNVSPTLTISASPDYADTDVVSGIVTLSSVAYSSGKTVRLNKVVLAENSGQAPALEIIFFRATPASGTYTDNSALVWGAGDLANVAGSLTIATGDWVVTVSKSVCTKRDLNMLLTPAASDLFALIIAKGAYNAAATSDLLARFTFEQEF